MLRTCIHIQTQSNAHNAAGYDDSVTLLYRMASDRPRLVDLRKTLACSNHLRGYFRRDGEDANSEPRLVLRGSTNDITNTKHAQLLSLLRTITEPSADQRIPHDRIAWAREILPLLNEENGRRWMTDYGDWKAEEYRDASFVLTMLKRFWAFSFYRTNPNDPKYNRWRDHKRSSDNLRAIDVEEFVTIVKKHMLTPPGDSSSQAPSTEDSSPQVLFDYVSR